MHLNQERFSASFKNMDIERFIAFLQSHFDSLPIIILTEQLTLDDIIHFYSSYHNILPEQILLIACNFAIQAGLPLNVRPPLHSDHYPSSKTNRKKIAVQFFGLFSPFQIRAFHKRVVSMSKYFEAYNFFNILDFRFPMGNLKKIMRDHLGNLPLKSKLHFTIAIGSATTKRSLMRLRDEIVETVRTNPLNFAKALYPIFSQTLAFMTDLFEGDEELAGKKIGSFRYPLERVIEKARQSPPGSPLHSQAQDMEKLIEKASEDADYLMEFNGSKDRSSSIVIV
jgi:hypothetical protein